MYIYIYIHTIPTSELCSPKHYVLNPCSLFIYYQKAPRAAKFLASILSIRFATREITAGLSWGSSWE